MTTDYGKLSTAFTAYNTKFGTKKTRELIPVFNKEMKNTDALNWALAKSQTMIIESNIDSWKTTYIDGDASFTDKTVLATYVTDLDKL